MEGGIMPLAPELIDVVADNNLKQIGELHAAQTGLMREEAVRSWSSDNRVSNAFTGSILKKFAEADPEEARSVAHMLTGDAIGDRALVSTLVTSLAAILSKLADRNPSMPA